jgi:hypothetical protein
MKFLAFSFLLTASLSTFASDSSVSSASNKSPVSVSEQYLEITKKCDLTIESERCGEYGHSSCTVQFFKCPIEETQKQIQNIVGKKIISIEAADENSTKWNNLKEIQEINNYKVKVIFFDTL